MGLSREVLRQHVWVEGWISWEQKRVSNKRKTALLRVLRPQALFSFSALSTCSKETWAAETQHPWYVVGKLFLLLVREMSGSRRRLAALSRSLSNSFRRLWPRLLNNCCFLCLLIGYNFRNSRTEWTPLPSNTVLSRTGQISTTTFLPDPAWGQLEGWQNPGTEPENLHRQSQCGGNCIWPCPAARKPQLAELGPTFTKLHLPFLCLMVVAIPGHTINSGSSQGFLGQISMHSHSVNAADPASEITPKMTFCYSILESL